MLENTFQHIPGIGGVTERKFWSQGLTTMREFLESPPEYLSGYRKGVICEEMERSLERLSLGDSGFFSHRLRSHEHWRMFSDFRGSTAYLDIETTGLGSPGDIITAISLYDGHRVRSYVNGENLCDFPGDLSSCRLLVTYNGKTFDIPFIERYFGITVAIPHIDLRYVLHSLGIRGGLKCCEMRLGAGRNGPLALVDGYMAVLMWEEYRRTGSRSVLDTLLHYNAVDTVNLEFLMVEAYNRKLKELPIPLEPEGHGQHPDIPFRLHEDIVDRIRRRKYGWD